MAQNILSKFQTMAQTQSTQRAEVVGLFATPEDRPYIKRFQEIAGISGIKSSFEPQQYMAQLKLKVQKYHLTSIIITCSVTLETVLKSLPDFKVSYMKNGKEKKPSLNDYHGSFIKIPGPMFGRENGEGDLQVLILNPLAHLYSVPEAEFVFKRFISKITKPDNWIPHVPFTWKLWPSISKPEEQHEIFKKFSTALVLSVDIETTVDSPLRTIECVSYSALFSDGSISTICIPTLGLSTREEEFQNILWMRKFNALSIPKLFQNGLYDNLYFFRYGCPCDSWFFDTFHMFHSWYSELPKSLDFITAFTVRFARYWKDDSKTGSRFDYYQYNAQDAWSTLMAFLGLLKEYPEWAERNYVDHEFPMVFPCLHMASDGLQVDITAFNKSYEEVSAKLAVSRKKFDNWIGPSFNPNSPLQVKRLMEVLGVPNVTSSGEKEIVIASDSGTFTELVLAEILEYRGLSKLLSTYLVREKFWHNRVYYSLNPGGTDSGRMACDASSYWCGFQIQNVPRGPEVKSYICADTGYHLAEGDYAQSEARCVGYLSGCNSLIDLVESSHDYHAWNASQFFGVRYEDIYDEAAGKTLDKVLRDLSKRTNHGANYNMGGLVMYMTMGPKKVRQAQKVLNLPANWKLVKVCEFLLEQYAKTYPEVKKDYIEWAKRTISITKKLVSPLGWTRHFFNDLNKSKHALNSAIAHAPQNLSVCLINKALYQIWRESVYGKLRLRIRLKAQIHDSIFFAHKIGDEDAAQQVKQMMRQPVMVKDIKGVEREMVIPVDLNYGETHWSKLK